MKLLNRFVAVATRLSLLTICILLTWGTWSANVALGQDGPGIPPVVEPPVQQPVTQTPIVDNGGGTGQDQTSGNVTVGDGVVDPQALDFPEIEDSRNQGFVGATAPGISELGFVGAASDSSGPPLSDGATFGGGVNGSGTGGGGQGGFGNGLNGGLGAQGGFGAFNQNGFEVTRRNLRTRIAPRFASPVVSGQQTTQRFQNRLVRLPSMLDNPALSTVQVSIVDRVATLTGAVQTLDQRDQIERQLRLEPGVDQIVNQIYVP